MVADREIRRVWHSFAGVPMETFTKGWWYLQCGGSPRQRTVDELVAHRQAFGAGGNCFDLALWLHHAFLQSGIPARIIGTDDAHVAVIATDEAGTEYLCDLGDQWLQPVPIDNALADGWQAGFFPGREVRLAQTESQLQVYYRRSNGKVATQAYNLRPLSDAEFRQACHQSQNDLRRPFCEMLLPHPETGTVEHWEYDRGKSFWNLAAGPVFEAPCQTQEEWVARIGQRTGMSGDLITKALQAYV